MKNKVFFSIFLLIGSLLFGHSAEYEKKINLAKQYEEEDNIFKASIAYYEAVLLEPEDSGDAMLSLDKIFETLSSGKPGYDEYDDFSFYDKWMEILSDAEKYFSTNFPYTVLFTPLHKESVNFDTRTGNFKTSIIPVYVDFYNILISSLSEGYQKYQYEQLKEYDKKWPEYSASRRIYDNWKVYNSTAAGEVLYESTNSANLETYNLDGALVTVQTYAYNMDEINYFFKAKNSFRNANSYFFDIVLEDEKGNEISKNITTHPFYDIFFTIDAKYFKDIEKGKINPVIKSIKLAYGPELIKDHYNKYSIEESVEKGYMGTKDIELKENSFFTTNSSYSTSNNSYLRAKLLSSLKAVTPYYEECLGKEVEIPIEQIVYGYPSKPRELIELENNPPVIQPVPEGLSKRKAKKEQEKREAQYKIELEEYNQQLNKIKSFYESQLNAFQEKMANDYRSKYKWSYVIVDKYKARLPYVTSFYDLTTENSGGHSFYREFLSREDPYQFTSCSSAEFILNLLSNTDSTIGDTFYEYNQKENQNLPVIITDKTTYNLRLISEQSSSLTDRVTLDIYHTDFPSDFSGDESISTFYDYAQKVSGLYHNITDFEKECIFSQISKNLPEFWDENYYIFVRFEPISEN